MPAPDTCPPDAPDWVKRVYLMGGIRPGETEAEFCERRRVESHARYREHLAAIEWHKADRAARGEPEPDSGPGYYGVGGHLSASEYWHDGIMGREPSGRRGWK